MKNYIIILAFSLFCLSAFSQQEPLLTDSIKNEPVLIDTSTLEPMLSIDTPIMQIQPVVVDTPAIQYNVEKLAPVAVVPVDTNAINLHLQKAKLTVRGGNYYLAGGLGGMVVGGIMVALSHTITVKEPQLLGIAGYGFMSIGGVFAITGLAQIIHGKRMMKQPPSKL